MRRRLIVATAFDLQFLQTCEVGRVPSYHRTLQTLVFEVFAHVGVVKAN